MSASIVNALKKLAVKMKGDGAVSDIPGSSISSVIDGITENYSIAAGPKGEKGDKGDKGDPGDPGTPGAKGDPGKGVKSIALTTNEGGQVTGGTVTFDDESTAPISVSQGGV